MTKTTTQAAAIVLSALMTLAVVAGMNGIATKQYAAADALAMAPYGQAHVAVQHVTIVGHRANA
jgi:ABC-type amino acid transport system permease subunit